MSNLSSRVMNMKFMQKGGTETKEEETVKNVRDSSEWALPSSSNIISKSRKSNAVETIGYTSINAYNSEDISQASASAPSVRRVWGTPKVSDADSESGKEELKISKLKDSIDKKTKKSSQSEDAPKEFLRNLWDKSQQYSEEQVNEEEVELSKKRKGDYIPNIKFKQKRLPN
ncbi:hypothetical protein CLIB1423_02S02608 [[Candida] railenensis]|uniref:Uncharacterized protein n=1 Tax=[Candida] railenensis TaxID=45579 RepID=A0A9P0QL69_9ASCO|nr:hypothetical protein CLIB1423_02S02608 [[Candida] railenensis]